MAIPPSASAFFVYSTVVDFVTVAASEKIQLHFNADSQLSRSISHLRGIKIRDASWIPGDGVRSDSAYPPRNSNNLTGLVNSRVNVHTGLRSL